MTPRRSLLRALLHPIRATVEKYIHASPRPVTLAELADALDLEARLVSHHVQVLVACGLIVLDGDGRARAT